MSACTMTLSMKAFREEFQTRRVDTFFAGDVLTGAKRKEFTAFAVFQRMEQRMADIIGNDGS